MAVIALCIGAARADDWPQWRGPQRDGVWRETGIVEKFDQSVLKPLWRALVSSGYCGPTVAAGRVYLMDRVTTPVAGERVLCFDAANGAPLWTRAYECRYERIGYPAGPRACVTINDGRAYSLGTMGRLHCLDAGAGEVLWKKDLKVEYRLRIPTWGVTAAPLVEGDLVILHVGGADGACLIALDKRTGEERWKALDDRVSYSAPIAIGQAGKRVIVCVTGERVVGLDPRTGRLYWDHPFPPTKMPIAVPTPVLYGDYLFVTSFYDGSLLLKLPRDQLTVEPVWRRKGKNERETDALHCMISTPFIEGDYIYGVDSYGQLRCLDLKTGDRVWENRTATTQARWGTAHLVRNGKNVWMFNELGELIIARLTPKGYEEISRARLIEPTLPQSPARGAVCWSPPAFANKRVYARNDEELLCADLSAR